MIHADLDKSGMMKVTGRADVILSEYAILTRVVYNQLIDDFGKEKANRVLADIGKLAVSEPEDLTKNLKEIFEAAEGVYTDES